jgi:hypothetical protein
MRRQRPHFSLPTILAAIGVAFLVLLLSMWVYGWGVFPQANLTLL